MKRSVRFEPGIWAALLLAGVIAAGPAQARHRGASTEANKAVVRQIVDGINKGDMTALGGLVSSDFVGHGGRPDQDLHGPAGFTQSITDLRTAFPDLQITVEDQIAEGDKVVTRYTMHGTQQGSLGGIPASGKSVTASGIVIDRIANGKLAETWNQPDRLGVMIQTGAFPPPGAAAPTAPEKPAAP